MKGSSKKVTSSRKNIKCIRMQQGEILHVGVDVHKRTFHAAVWSDMRGLVETWVQPASAAALVQRLKPLSGHIAQVVYEAGPTGYGLVRALRAAGFAAAVVAPSEIPSKPGKRAKSDRLDCRKLAEYSAKDLLRPVHVPTEDEEADRQLVRLREQVMKKRKRVKKQIKSFLLMHDISEPKGLASWTLGAVKELQELELREELRFCLNMLLDELEHVESQLKQATRRIRTLAESAGHRKETATLQTVSGVGPITAITFKSELPAPERFGNEREIASMIGLAPRVSQSGETRKEGHIMKSGKAYLRALLVEASWSWVRRDSEAAKKYQRLVRNTGSARKAIVAMARRLAILLWRMLLKQRRCNPVA